jgi:N-acetylglucosamine kinase-like BadF-type ATPase
LLTGPLTHTGRPGTAGVRPLYGVDAGGSSTAIRASDGTAWRAQSVNPASVGTSAEGALTALFERIRDHAAGQAGRPMVWLASAAVPPSSPRQAAARIAALARATGLRGDLVISNDITPLVLGGVGQAGHVVAICGTGSGFAASDGTRRLVRVGSCEYLGSDEGSAFDLAMRGLRSAARSLDGRAEPTVLASLFAIETGVTVPELARRLAAMPFPKAAVAALAPVVLRGWQQQDDVARRLVADAVDELVLGVRAARDLACLGSSWTLSTTGGVFVGSPEFFRAFAAAAWELGPESVRLIDDPAAAVLMALDRLLAGAVPVSSGPDSEVCQYDLVVASEE